MNKIEAFQQFLVNESVQVSITHFIVNLILTAILSGLLSRLYVRYGSSLSNRKLFARQFVLLACTTMLIITVVKASLALSLGLVGALSIVRFRAAIKEPEELVYLFLNIAIGLGFGASQRIVTIVGFACLAGVIVAKGFKGYPDREKNFILTLANSGKGSISLEQAIKALTPYCSHLDLKRFDEQKDSFEASFDIACDSFEKLQAAIRKLIKGYPTLKVSFSDFGGIL